MGEFPLGQQARGPIRFLFAVAIIASGDLKAAVARNGVKLHRAVQTKHLDDVTKRFELAENGGGHAMIVCLFLSDSTSPATIAELIA